jgi:hypothetical protein
VRISAAIATIILIICLFFNCRKKELIEDPVPTPPRDTCTVHCLNGGTCLDNACNCPEKFYGDSCQKYFTYRFEGDYISTDFDCGLGAGGQVLRVNVHPTDSNRLLIGNFIADMTDTRNFVLPAQSGASSGSGTITRDSLNISYSTSLVIININCHGSFLKKK